MPTEYSKSQALKITLALCLAQFCIAADIATLSIATSSLIDYFQSNVDDLKVVGSIYPLIGASLMLTSGVLGLYIGWRRMLIAGLCIGVLGSIAKIFSPSVDWMTYIARPLIGFAGVAILPACIALVIGHFPAKKHAQLFGLIAASTGLAAAIIPILNGLLIDTIGWHAGFITTGTLYVITAVAATIWIPPLVNKPPKKFDLKGAVISLVGMMCIIAGLLKAPDWGILTNHSSLPIPHLLPPISPTLLFIASGILLMALFVRHERKFDKQHQSALIPRNWFTNYRLTLGLLLLLTMYVIFGGLNFTLVAYLQVGLSLTAAQTGLIVLTFAISLITSSIITPRIFDRFENSTVACLGFALCIIGALLTVASTDAYTFHLSLYFAMTAFGLGLGMLSSQTVAVITKSVTKEEAERTGGLQATIRNVGLAMGIAIVSGSGQFAMETNIREQVALELSPSSQILQHVDSTQSIPYITNNVLSLYLDELDIVREKKQFLMEINANARKINFHTSMYIIVFFALIGMIAGMRLRAQK